MTKWDAWIAAARGGVVTTVERLLPDSRHWRTLYLAYSISCLGDEFSRVALFARGYNLKAAVAGVALVVVAQALPGFIVAPIAGVLSDRGRQRTCLVAADFARFGILILMVFTTSMPGFLSEVALMSAFTAFFRPVEAAYEADILPSDELTRANSLRTGINRLLAIIGTGLAAVVIVALGVRGALLVDACSFVLSGVILLRLPDDPAARSMPDKKMTGELRRGIEYLFQHSGIRILFLSMAVLTFILGCQCPLFYDFAVKELKGGASTYAWLMTALSAGTIIGASLLGKIPGVRRLGLPLLMAVLAFDGVVLYAFTYGGSVTVCLFWMALMGLMAAAIAVIERVYIQSTPPPKVRGRILGAFDAMEGPVTILSLALAIYVSRFWSSATTLRVLAVGEMGIALISLLALLVAHHPRPTARQHCHTEYSRITPVPPKNLRGV